MRPVRLACLALALVASAALPQDFQCPDRGGPPWREVRTAHFSVWTDLPSGKGRELAEDVERVLEAVRFGLFQTPPEMTGMIRVFAPRSSEEFALFAPKNAGAFFVPNTPGGPFIVLPGFAADWGRIALAHELTHLVTSRVFARQPPWFREGLASYMETVGTSGVGATPTVGGVLRYRVHDVFPYHGGIAPVLTARGRLPGNDAEDVSRAYSRAWTLVHFLFNRHPKEFTQLQIRFGRGVDPATAWREVFPAWDPDVPGAMDALDDEIGTYVAHGKFGYRDIHLPPAPAVVERALTAADAHDVRLSLPWLNQGDEVPTGKLKAEIEEALGHDPGCVAALSLLAAKTPEKAVPLAEKATAAHPGDARAWLLLAQSLPADGASRRETALRKATEADPANTNALNDLAWDLLGTGRSGEALPLASKAAGLEPWNPAVLDTLAGVLEDLGSCADALAVQRRAVDVLPERIDAKARVPFVERLARLEAKCAPKTGAPPVPKGK